MSALIPTDYYAEIKWIGVVEDQENDIRSTERKTVDVGWDGVPGEFHGGRTREACSRVKSQHPVGTEIANVRQFSIVSEEEMQIIAVEIGVDVLQPEWLGASLVVSGIDDFTHLPPSSRLQNEAGTTFVVDMVNRPCNWPGKEIEKEHPGAGRKFVRAGKGRRGVTAWVERPGPLSVGDTLRLHVPDQRAWAHHEGCLTGKQL
ncbi:MAG: MOSC domain-containing protein [Pseudomonadota bacterium]